MSPKLRRRAIVAALVCALALSIVIDALWIEPYRIEITRHQIAAPLASPLRIVHLTDIHTYGIGKVERELIEMVNAEQPDVIVSTGDLISDSGSYEGAREVLKSLHARLGVWVVRGNHEVWYPAKDDRAFYESAGATLLVNESKRIADNVWLVGLDDAFAGSPNLELALAGIPPAAFKLALFHSPIFFDAVAGTCDLALAGHTHGGQIRVPLLPPFWLPGACGRYLEGWYELAGSRMYVNRGIGTSIMPIRFLCRPEIAVITIGPA